MEGRGPVHHCGEFLMVQTEFILHYDIGVQSLRMRSERDVISYLAEHK